MLLDYSRKTGTPRLPPPPPSPMIFLPCLTSISSTTAPNCSMALTVCKKTQNKTKKKHGENGRCQASECERDHAHVGRPTRSPLSASSGWTLPCSVRPVLKPAFLHSRRGAPLPQ